MKNKNKFTSLFLAFTLALSLILSNVPGFVVETNATVATTSYANTNAIDDGAILHCWNWSFDTIKSKLPEIAEAGYTAIQTSPIQASKDDYTANSQWWILYQPLNFKIGNTQLGSRDQFKSMCEEAEKYGINVIVDVVANHLGNNGGGDQEVVPSSKIDEQLKNSNYWHEQKAVQDWNDRWQVTHWGIGLPDLNTSNKELQNIILAFLNDAIACGADGFRFDAAKHIELPNDPDGSDFWPYILGNLNNKENLYIYGEVLQGGADNITGYHNYIGTTVDYYGGSVRSAVGYNTTANVNNAKNYPLSGSASNFVTWVESHDTYANDHKETVGLTNTQIKLAWAILAGRSGSTPLFFNRTAGGYLAGSMGSAGDDMWKDPTVVAANNFRNAMVGQGEYIRTVGNNIWIAERGTKGMMIVNVGGATNVESATNLPNGQYKDTVSGNTFTVSNGKISGNIGGQTIATIYVEDIPAEPKVEASVSSGTNFVDSLKVTLTATNTVTSTYSIDGGAAKSYTNGQSITLGSDKEIGDKVTLVLKGIAEDGKEVSKTYTYNKVEKSEAARVYLELPSGWSNPNIYVYDESGSTTVENAKWPGIAMTKDSTTGYYYYELPEGFENASVIFNSGSSQIPGSMEAGLNIAAGESKLYSNGSWKDYDGIIVTPPSDDIVAPNDGKTRVYLKNFSGWGTPNVYIYNESGSTTIENAKWPGVAMTNEGNGYYSYTLPDSWNVNAEVIFNSGNNQYPGSMQKGLTLKVGEQKLYNGSEWVDMPIKSSIEITNFVADKKSPQDQGTEIQLSATAENGDGTVKYTFSYSLNGGEYVAINTSNTANKIAWIPNEAGNYTLKVEAVDSKDNSAEKTIEYVINEVEKELDSSITIDKTEGNIGDSFEITASSIGGYGSIQYKYYYKKDSQYTMIKDYSYDKSATWTPTEAGTYEVFLQVKDSKGTVVTKNVTVKIKGEEIESTLTINKNSGNVGDEFIISANGTGGIGSLQYKYYYKKDGQYTMIKDYSASKTVTWNPTAEGRYEVYLQVKDSVGSVVTKCIIVNIENKFTAKLGLSSNFGIVGEEIELTSNVVGGTGNLEYKYYYQKDSKYILIKDYSESKSLKWTPSESGKYIMYLQVKDSTGEVITTTTELAVDGERSDLTADVKVSTTSISLGNEIEISASSNGGNGLIEYKYYYKKGDKYVMIQDFSDAKSVQWTPEESGVYTVYLQVRDSLGQLVTKAINVTVKEAVKITNIALDKDTIKVGQQVKITTTATGSNLQYRVAIHDYEDAWTTLHEFKSSNVTTWTPSVAGECAIWVDVIDEDGNYDTQLLEIKVTE